MLRWKDNIKLSRCQQQKQILDDKYNHSLFENAGNTEICWNVLLNVVGINLVLSQDRNFFSMKIKHENSKACQIVITRWIAWDICAR